MRKFLPAFFVLTIAISSLALGTAAYFTAQATSAENIFTSGSLAVNLQESSGTQWDDWQPGELQELEFSVTNTGSMPVTWKGYFDGSWDNGEDGQYVTIQDVAFNIDGLWQLPVVPLLALSDEFFFASDGTETTSQILEPGELVWVKFSVVLDPSTPNEYQNSVFTGSLHLAAKQVVTGATWPLSY